MNEYKNTMSFIAETFAKRCCNYSDASAGVINIIVQTLKPQFCNTDFVHFDLKIKSKGKCH